MTVVHVIVAVPTVSCMTSVGVAISLASVWHLAHGKPSNNTAEPVVKASECLSGHMQFVSLIHPV